MSEFETKVITILSKRGGDGKKVIISIIPPDVPGKPGQVIDIRKAQKPDTKKKK